MGNSAKRDTRKVDIAERRRQLLVLRRQGASYEECARALGLHDKSHAHKEFHEALGEITEDEAASYRKMTELRFDSYRLALHKKIKAGDVQAIGEARQLERDQAKILGYAVPAIVTAASSAGGPESAPSITIVYSPPKPA